MICELQVLTGDGDIRLTWNPAVPEEVGKAKEEFDRLKRDGYAFFSEDETEVKLFGSAAAKVADGRLTVRTTKTFDSGAKRTVAVRPMRGG